jgi:hypothetical protein
MTPDDLRRRMDAFLALYNPDRSVKGAEKDALKSAAQHNSLYATGVTERDRCLVRAEWKRLLNDAAKKYESLVSVDEYEGDIENLCKTMNTKFKRLFRSERHPKFGYDHGFRVSHAQKSLSVFLKHRWCLNDNIKEPPQCPVDARVLKAAGARNQETRWTYVNTIEEHRTKIALLTACATGSGLRLAVWELVAFQA